MSKIRINDLARELEVKSRAILDALTEVGVTEKKTHSSSLEEHEAALVRKHLTAQGDDGSGAAKSSRTARPEDGIKTKIDLSNISRPGDVLRAIQQKVATGQAPARPVAQPPVAPPPTTVRPETPVVPAAVKPPLSKPAAETPAPKFVTPASVALSRPPAAIVIPPKPPAA